VARARARGALAAFSAIVVVGSALALSRTGLPFGAAPSANITLPSEPDDVRDILPSLQAMWLWTGQDAGGYAETSSFRSAPSLYQTAWNLRVAKYLGIATGTIDEPGLRAWLQQVARDPSSAHELSEAQALHLALQALRDLGGSAISGEVAATLDRLRDGTEYRPAADADSTVGSTVLAIQSMDLAGISVPSDVRTAIAQDLIANCGKELAPQDLVSVLLPELEIAKDVLSQSQIDSLRSQVGHQLTLLTAATAGTSGVDVTVLSRVQSLVHAYGITGVPDPKAIPFDTLTAYDGELMLTPGDRDSSDPQATYYGLLLGMKPNDRLIDTVRRTALRVGWLSRPTRVTPQFTFYGTVVDHALGHRGHDDPIRHSVESWLHVPASAEIGDVTDLYYSVALARELQLDVPSSIRDWVAQVVDNPSAFSVKPAVLAWVARLAYLLGLSVNAQISDNSSSDMQPTMRDVFSTWTWSKVLQSDSLAAKARKATGSLAMTDGTFRYAASVGSSDLRSTVMGCLITSTPCASRVRAFARDGLAWMFEADQSEGDGAELLTSYLWVLGSGRTNDWAGVY
jgi:hypothetical protein